MCNIYPLFLAARIASELATISEKAILHEKGNFVLEKVIDAGAAPEIMTIFKPLCAKPYEFAHHKFAVMKMAKGVDKLVSFASSRPFKIFSLCENLEQMIQDQERLGAALSLHCSLHDENTTFRKTCIFFNIAAHSFEHTVHHCLIHCS